MSGDAIDDNLWEGENEYDLLKKITLTMNMNQIEKEVWSERKMTKLKMRRRSESYRSVAAGRVFRVYIYYIPKYPTGIRNFNISIVPSKLENSSDN